MRLDLRRNLNRIGLTRTRIERDAANAALARAAYYCSDGLDDCPCPCPYFTPFAECAKCREDEQDFGEKCITCWDRLFRLEGILPEVLAEAKRRMGCKKEIIKMQEKKIVTMEEFVKILSSSEKLTISACIRDAWRSPINVKLAKGIYGGYNTDRIADRNSLTNKCGFEHVEGRKFLSLDDGSGVSILLAGVLQGYGREFRIYEGGVELVLKHNISNETMTGYGNIKPTVERARKDKDK